MQLPAKTLMAATVGMACLMMTTEVKAQQNEKLSGRQKAIIPIAAFTGSGNMPGLETALTEGMDAGLTVNEIKEILVHTYAYAGFPRALNGINAYMAVMADRKEKGITDNEGKAATPMPSGFDRTAYGHRVRNALVGSDMSNRTNGYPAFAPVIDRFLVEHLFAEIFYRDILSHQDRELVTVSILAAMTGTEAQLKTHLRICMNVGLSKAQLEEFVKVLRQKVGAESAERSAATLNDLLGTSPPLNQAKSVKVIKNKAPTKGAAAHFTGNVTVESQFASEILNGYRGAIVTFDAGARTAWHSHPLGQTLIVVSGRGLVQSEGDAVQEILPGDVVWIPPNELHWHGAAPDSPMSHVAISDPLNDSTVKWMEPVSNEQYRKTPQ
ncbi:MAG: carboxymuconolactone decarboxylase family protein [Verrucomicrobiae bacterium]|nr:carboxymuconolactone decarboxylase family protein [Verrucomicrobiae bacterium]